MAGLDTIVRSWGSALRTINAPFAFGFAAALAWMSVFYSAATVELGFKSVTGSPANDVYLASLVITFAVDLIAALLPRRTLEVIELLGYRGFGAAMAIGTVMIVGPGLVGLEVPLLSGLGIVLAGASSALFLLCWALAFGNMPVRAMFPPLVLAYILSSGVNAIMPLSNSYTVVGISFVLPFVSLVCIKLGERQLCEKGIARYGSGSGSRSTAKASTDRSAQTEFPVRMLVKLCVVFLVWASVNRMLRVEYDAAIGQESTGHFAIAYTIATLAIIVIITVIVSILLTAPRRFQFERVYRVFFLFSLAGVLMLPFVVEGRADAVSVLAYACNTAGYQIFCMFMWVIIAASCHNYPRGAVRFFGITGGAWGLGAVGGVLLGTFFEAAPSHGEASAIAMVAVMAISLCYTVVFTENDAKLLAEIIPSHHKSPFKDKCREAGRRFGLTGREMEVMMLIAQGRDTSYIQEKLFLSRSTIQTHRMHLYQKTGVHSKQELLDVIEQTVIS